MAITADELVRRNARFAADGAFTDLPFPSNQTLRVIGCVDSRVDPSHVLGLDLGEAVVMRNIGGRVTPPVLRSWQLLAKLGQQGTGDQPGGGPPHLVVMHHTDCGIKRLADYPEMLAEFFEIPVTDLNTKRQRPVRGGQDRRRHPPAGTSARAARVGSGLRHRDRTHRGRRSAYHMSLRSCSRPRPWS